MPRIRGAVALACLLGGYLRLWPVLSASFPLNDGGLFYRMTQELIANRFSLPAFTSYNQAGIPFAYPPLGLYLLGLVSQLTGATLLDVQRVLPALVSVSTIPVFASLAGRLLKSPGQAAIAALAFALLPRSWLWFIMGGGITRALGFFFVLLMLDRLLAAYVEGRTRDVALAALSGAGAVASHLESAWFGAYTAVLLFLAYGRTRRGARVTSLAGLGTVLLTAPWWLSVLSHHGTAPFLYAAQSGGQDEFSLDTLRYFTFSGEPFLSVLAVLGFLGALAAVVAGRPFVPLWLVVIFLINPRNPATPATVPLALLVAIGVCELIVPGVAALMEHRPNQAWLSRAPLPARIPPAALLLLPIFGFVFLSSRSVAGNSTLLQPLSNSDRRAMAWSRSHTADSARFLVLTGKWFGQDAAAEWFPVLAGRVSTATVQGSEWLPGRRFYRGWKETDSLRTCRTTGCVRRWLAAGRGDPQFLYVRQGLTGELWADLRETPDLQIRYDQDSVLILERR
jgi:hypothetical protein